MVYDGVEGDLMSGIVASRATLVSRFGWKGDTYGCGLGGYLVRGVPL